MIIHKFNTSLTIRANVWHPIQPLTLFVGTGAESPVHISYLCQVPKARLLLQFEYIGPSDAKPPGRSSKENILGFTSEMEVDAVLVDYPVSCELKMALTLIILVSILMQSLELHRPFKHLPITNR